MKKILTIDDELDFSYFIKVNLELAGGYEVILASNGKDGVRLAQEHQPDLILLDIMMPGIDGFETLKRLKKNQKTSGIPVIMLTARDDDKSKTKSTRLDCAGYLVKPVETRYLKNKIDEVLAPNHGDYPE